MAEKKKVKYLTKSIRFGTKEITLYSIDGSTWSSRKDELLTILERHEAERLKLLASMGEVKAEATEENSSEKESKEDDSPMIMGDEGDDAESGAKKVGKMAGKPATKIHAKAAAAKNGKGKAGAKSRDRVAFVSPKPRQIAKQRKKAAVKGKRKAA